jgi:hypothetical protein
LWLPGYAKSCWHRASTRDQVRRVWLTIADHYEPLLGRADLQAGLRRVDVWRKLWPAIASRHTDSAGRPPVYTFFYPQEEYRAELIHPLAEMSAEGIADVEVHIHHDGEGEQDFIDRMSQFIEVLHGRHGLLRKENGQIRFGFIHGNWALDNSLPDGRGCGLNNELALLRDLGCYADFTLPSAPSPAQTRIVNTIYWATDDPSRPKSHDTGIPVADAVGACGDLLMIPGPLALNWTERSRGIFPRLETGELAGHNPVTAERVRLWLEFAPMIGNDLFLKLFAHGAPEINASPLLNRDLDFVFRQLHDQCGATGAELRFVSAFEMRQAVMGVTIGEGAMKLQPQT